MTQQEKQQDKKDNSVFPDEKNTPLEPIARRTGQGARQSDVRSGAEPEAPGNKNTDIPGDPNQGTEAR
jgi:photosystem I subunit 4